MSEESRIIARAASLGCWDDSGAFDRNREIWKGGCGEKMMSLVWAMLYVRHL